MTEHDYDNRRVCARRRRLTLLEAAGETNERQSDKELIHCPITEAQKSSPSSSSQCFRITFVPKKHRFQRHKCNLYKSSRALVGGVSLIHLWHHVLWTRFMNHIYLGSNDERERFFPSNGSLCLQQQEKEKIFWKRLCFISVTLIRTSLV